ncbi:transposase [Pediococcus pentosaceus]|nr:transposase [Pediococcus pentosaceus]
MRNIIVIQRSNGHLKGTNNKIKAIKKSSFDFQSFFKFRIIIFYVF